MTRAEHLQWAKNRALEYCDRGEVLDALNSLVSDLGKHPELRGHIGIQLGMMEAAAGLLQTPDAMRRFIMGFN